MTRTMRVWRWVVVSVLIAGGLASIAVSLTLRSSAIHQRVVDLLSDELESEVTLASLDGRLFPRVALVGDGLVIRHKGRTDVPPLITIPHFEIAGSPLALLRRPRHLAEIQLEGLEVQIPPGADDDSRDDASKSELPRNVHDVVIDRLEAPNAKVFLIRRNPTKAPRVFLIHHLAMTSVAPAHSMPFTATLTNPKPTGLIEASGTFGPWNVDDPSRTPVSGKFVFERADLGTIAGLGGILRSEGTFKGPLERIQVQGETETPDFRVDVGGHAVPLHTRYDAIVDGSNGDTILKRVDATFLNTALVASGAVTDVEGAPGRIIRVDVTMEDGRVEDLLTLVVKSEKSLLTGSVQLQASMLLPPGKGSVVDRLDLNGEFGLTRAKFTDTSVQSKIVGLSRRSQGKSNNEVMGEVVSDLNGRFVLDNGVVRFSRLAFGVPGALVELSGTYGLRTEQLDFTGTLRMRATVSQAAGGGMKSFFLKVFDPFFRKEGAGAVLPIRITGTRENPKFGLALF
jgi:hypothetical protein